MVKTKKSSLVNDPERRSSLETLPKLVDPKPNESEARGTNSYASLSIQEKLVIGLFTTKPGLSILKLYYELSCGRINLLRYKKWQQSKFQSLPDAVYKKLVKKWTGSSDYISALMEYLLRNDSTSLDYVSFYSAEYKLAFYGISSGSRH